MKKVLFLVSAVVSCSLATAFNASAQENYVVEEESVTVVDVANCKTQYSTPHNANWFIQLGAGIDVPMFENHLINGDAKRHITATYNLGFGRWFSPYMGFRISAYYGAWHWDNDYYTKSKFVNANFDIMWDMCNSLGGVNPDRPVSVVPFVGLGGTYAFDMKGGGRNILGRDGKIKDNTWALPVSAGIQFRFRLCRYADFFLEGRASFYGDNGNNYAFGRPIDVNIQAIGGLSFNIGGVNYTAYNPCKDAAYISALNGQINDLRGELAGTAAALAAAQAQLPCPEAKTVTAECPESAPLMSTVRFKINSAEISPEEMVNVYNMAQYLKDNPDVNVVIRGYADKDTGTSEYNMKLSERRCKAVYDTLVNTYGISADRLTTNALGSDSQPYTTNDWNRIVIFVPAD